MRPHGCARPLEQQLFLSRVLRQFRGVFEFARRFFEPSELEQQIAANSRQQVIALHRRNAGKTLDNRQCRRGALSHSDRNGAIQLDDGGGDDGREALVQRGDS